MACTAPSKSNSALCSSLCVGLKLDHILIIDTENDGVNDGDDDDDVDGAVEDGDGDDDGDYDDDIDDDTTLIILQLMIMMIKKGFVGIWIDLIRSIAKSRPFSIITFDTGPVI